MDSSADSMAPWMRRLRLRHLEVLLAISANGSLTAAAEALEASQPSISQWLADIEAALGVRLYERGRQLTPTTYLEPVLRHARIMVNESKRLRSELAAVASGGDGLVRLGAMHVAGPALVPQAICRIKAASPGTRIELVEDIAAGLWPKFERNELDVLVTRIDARAFETDRCHESLYPDRHCVIAGMHHPLSRMRRPGWRDAAPFPWILPPAATALRRSIDATFIAEHLAPPSPWLESVAMTANTAILGKTECLAVVSGSLARHLEKAGAVEIIDLRLTADIGPVGMVWRSADAAPAIRDTLAALRTVAKGQARRI